MSDLISQITADQNTLHTSFATAMQPIIHTRLVNAGLTGQMLTDTETAIINGIKEQENIVINVLVDKIYNQIQNKLINNYKMNLNVVTGVTQDPITKLITVASSNINTASANFT